MGPKKKGGKANKLARMTDEQRERYLQHRAAIEEETRRRKEQLIATFMRNKLKREEAFTRINSAKINQHWRHILRKIKCAGLQEDVENLWQSFDRVMDQKQRHKEELLSSLEVAERQYSDNLQSHLEIVEKLIDIHSKHINNLQALFSNHLSDYLNRAGAEKALINVTFEKENERLHVIRLAMEMDFNSSERQQQKYERVDKISEMQRKNKEDWETLVSEREQKLEEVWLQIQDSLHTYASETAAKRKTVQQLHDMDQDWLQTLANIQRTSRKITKMKENAENKINEMSERNESLQRERDSMLHAYKMLVERVGKETKRDNDKFQYLVLQSGNALKVLETVKNKGEKVLAVLLLCQRFECTSPVQEEQSIFKHDSVNTPNKMKFIPGMKRSNKINLVVKEAADFSDDYDEDDIADLERRELRVFKKLEMFWKRYNKALIETSNARMERDMLILENQKLKSTLRNYLLEMARVDSCGAPTGHRISTRPHTSSLPRFKTTIRVPQRPVSSVSWGANYTSRGGSAGSKRSISRASTSTSKPVILRDISSGSSNSDQWSL